MGKEIVLQDPSLMSGLPDDPSSPVRVYDNRSWSGPAIVLVKLAQDDPQRLHRFHELTQYALGRGADQHKARLFAKYHTSAFRTLAPTVTVVNGFKMVNSLVPIDSWRLMTNDIISIAQQNQTLLPRLTAAGLVDTVDNLGHFIVVWHSSTDLEDARVSMDGRSQITDEADLTLKGAPLPIFHKDFNIGWRNLLAAGNNGAGIDLNRGIQAGMKVAQREEAVAMNGAAITWGGFKLDGLTNHPDRQAEATALDFGTAANVETKFLNMTNLMRTANHNGPMEAWVSLTQFNQMQKRLGDGSDATGMSVALNIEGIEAVHPSSDLTDELVLVHMSPLVVKVAIGEDIRTIQWENPGGLSTTSRVFSAKVLKIFDGTGIVHGTAI